jgi:hypothetical protein
LREGIFVGTEEGGKALDRLWAIGKDDSISARFNELEGSVNPRTGRRYTEQEIADKMLDEGYGEILEE